MKLVFCEPGKAVKKIESIDNDEISVLRTRKGSKEIEIIDNDEVPMFLVSASYLRSWHEDATKSQGKAAEF